MHLLNWGLMITLGVALTACKSSSTDTTTPPDSKAAPTATAAATPNADAASAAASSPDVGINATPPAADPAKPAVDIGKPGSGGLTPLAIAELLSKSVCERMAACNQASGVSAADCASGMSKELASNLPEKARNVEKTALDACVGAIGKATCEELNSPEPPKGCEFMN